MTYAILLHPYFAHSGGQHNRVISAMYDRLLATAVVPHRFDFASMKESVARADAVAQIEACGGPALLRTGPNGMIVLTPGWRAIRTRRPSRPRSTHAVPREEPQSRTMNRLAPGIGFARCRCLVKWPLGTAVR
jgi:hypothetical protein